MTKILKSTLLAMTAAASIASAPAFAADNSILVVDFNQVYTDSAAGKSGSSQLATKYQATLTARQNAFNAAAQAYNSQVESARKAAKPNTQPPAATMTALQQAGERAQQAQDAMNQTREEANQAAAYVRQQIVEHAIPLAEQIRAERKANVVVPKDSVLASDPSADVTSTLIQRLNSSFPTPSITPPQAPAAQAARPTQGR